MAPTVNWLTGVVTIPETDMIPDGDGGRILDLDWLRLQLHGIEASEEGIAHLRLHRRFDPYTMSGIVYDQGVEIIEANGYSLLLEALGPLYRVVTQGGNTNAGDVQVLNGVGLVVNNSAGQTRITDGAGGGGDLKHGFR